MIRCIAGLLILFSTSSALADPILLLLLRFARDKAVTASLEAGVNNVRQQQYPTNPSPSYGFALPTPAIPRGNEDHELRALIDRTNANLGR